MYIEHSLLPNSNNNLLWLYLKRFLLLLVINNGGSDGVIGCVPEHHLNAYGFDD